MTTELSHKARFAFQQRDMRNGSCRVIVDTRTLPREGSAACNSVRANVVQKDPPGGSFVWTCLSSVHPSFRPSLQLIFIFLHG